MDEKVIYYTYNPLNQLSQYTDEDGNRTNYYYSPDGMRNTKIQGDITTKYYWDRNYMSAESVDGNITSKNYVGAQGIFARETTDRTDYMLKSGHGDVVSFVNNGTVSKIYDYDAYGVEKDPTSNDTNPFRYCGEYSDTESGQLYLRNRYYLPTTGRFITEDKYWNNTNRIYGDNPIKNGQTCILNINSIMQSNNLYVYCNNNPIILLDKNGANWIYDAWNWGEDNIWKGISKGVRMYGWQLTAKLLDLSSSGEGQSYSASSGSYASNLLKNDAGLNKFVNDVIWIYGTSVNNSNPYIPTQSYEIPLSNGDLGAALHNVYVDIAANRSSNGSWYATVTITDTFDFTEFKNPFKQDSVLKGLLWAANDIAYYDEKWGLLDPVPVTITYNNYY